MFLTEPSPFDEGAAAIRKLAVVDAGTFAALLPELQGMAITVSGMESLDQVRRIRDAIAKLPEGTDFATVRDAVADELTWLNPVAAAKRATLLTRMYGFRAYAAAAARQNEAHRDVFPFLQYIATMDSNTRPHHAALHGKVLPADHPFWLNHTGPWEFNCRCEAVALTEFETDEIRDADLADKALPPEERRVLEGAFRDRLEKQGQIVKPGGQGYFDVRTPRERTGDKNAFEWRAGDMGLPAAAIEKRYSKKDWAAWKARASRMTIDDGRTVWEWFTGKKPRKPGRKSMPGMRIRRSSRWGSSG